MPDEVGSLEPQPELGTVISGDDRLMVTVTLTDVDGTSWSANVYAPEPVDGSDMFVARLAVQALLGAARTRGDGTYAAARRALATYSEEP